MDCLATRPTRSDLARMLMKLHKGKSYTEIAAIAAAGGAPSVTPSILSGTRTNDIRGKQRRRKKVSAAKRAEGSGVQAPKATRHKMIHETVARVVRLERDLEAAKASAVKQLQAMGS